MKLYELIGNIDSKLSDIEIKGITTDSRLVEEGFAYICIKGTVNDGHNFAMSAKEKGAAVIIAEKETGTGIDIIVDDTHAAFATMSAKWFDCPADKLKLIGVTGTNGKTSVTYMIKKILEANGEKVGLIGTIQNMIGEEIIETKHTTPDCYKLNELFALMVQKGCTYVVMEVSSHALDQKRVYGVEFEAAVFTNLTQDHLDYHVTMENYMLAKKRLFSMCKTAIINSDDKYAESIAEGLDCKAILLSAENDKATYYAKDIDYKADGVGFVLCSNGIELPLNMNTGGKFTVYNAMSAAVSTLTVGVSEEIISEALSAQSGVKGRAEVVKNPFDFTIIIDYAHTPDGLSNILNTFAECKKGRLIALFGCGGDRDKTKRPIMGEIAAEKADFLIVTSDNPRSENPQSIIEDILSGVKNKNTPYVAIENRIEAINYAIENAKKGDIIVLAGKGHETYQILADRTIHLDEREIVAEAIEKRKEAEK
ncbi:MAG: UDP-N-acetylmuramoyl-L-alanyl-D-glutamate--2,6-diaminopimelate ligase [Ruminococcaceae bacterium]|nr:UDP-N-acetylmuramoyl-L-alanyl-D-glutamate--2,6-diaminopimelate ligase [Oscillospiraceae bacterium]